MHHMQRALKMTLLTFLKPTLRKLIIFLVVAVVLSFIIEALFGRPVVVTGGHMEPNYRTGDLAFFKKVTFDELAVGDVIVHDMEPAFEDTKSGGVIMRVVTKDEVKRTYATKGDNNRGQLSTQIDLGQDTIGGRVTTRIPYLGYLELVKILLVARIAAIYIIACWISTKIWRR